MLASGLQQIIAQKIYPSMLACNAQILVINRLETILAQISMNDDLFEVLVSW